jgi:hypothetical protein
MSCSESWWVVFVDEVQGAAKQFWIQRDTLSSDEVADSRIERTAWASTPLALDESLMVVVMTKFKKLPVGFKSST